MLFRVDRKLIVPKVVSDRSSRCQMDMSAKLRHQMVDLIHHGQGVWSCRSCIPDGSNQPSNFSIKIYVQRLQNRHKLPGSGQLYYTAWFRTSHTELLWNWVSLLVSYRSPSVPLQTGSHYPVLFGTTRTV